MPNKTCINAKMQIPLAALTEKNFHMRAHHTIGALLIVK